MNALDRKLKQRLSKTISEYKNYMAVERNLIFRSLISRAFKANLIFS